MTEVTAKKVILKNKDGEYLIPYTENGGCGLEVGDIGIAALGIDESKGLRRYLNGSILYANTNTQEFVNKLKTAGTSYPSLVCTEEEWQAIASSSVGGQCGKFVINYDTDGTTVLSIRLPKIIMPVQGLTDMTKLGEIVEAGLPNIEGSHGGLEGANFYTSGAFTIKDTKQHNGAGAGAGDCYVSFDASLSNDIYGKSETVQPEQVQYPYFIQIATGQQTEVNIVNDIELNNPYTLFDSKYSETPLYNVSWLKSDGTFYSKSVYVTAYEALVVENNTEIDAGTSVQLPSGTTYIKRGLSVKLSTAEDITDYDFVINAANETFRLPLKSKIVVLSGDTVSVNIYGDGTALGLTNSADGSIVGALVSSQSVGAIFRNRLDTELPYAGQGSDTPFGNSQQTVGLSVDPAKSGIVGDIDLNSDNNLYLYFYVGETVQNANLIDAGRLAEQLSNKTYVTETYVNGTSWYRLWSDGWCEQGGQTAALSASTQTTIELLKEYSNTDYFINVNQPLRIGVLLPTVGIYQKNTANFIVQQSSSGNEAGAYATLWYACGF